MLYFAGFFFSVFFTFATLILVLCLRGNARSIALNLLLLFATSNIVLLVLVNYLPAPPVKGKELDTKLADNLKATSRALDEACKIEYAQKHWPVLKCATTLDFPLRDPSTVMSEEIDRSAFAGQPEKCDDILQLVDDLRKEHRSKERVIQGDRINDSLIKQLPPGWLKDEALRFNAVHSIANPKFLNELEQRRIADGERFANVMVWYCVYYICVLLSGLFIVSNAILWLKNAEKGPDSSIRLIASGRAIYSVFLIGLYASVLVDIPAEIFNYVFKDSIPKLTATALTSICSCLGMMAGGLIAAKKLVLEQSELSLKEAFPLKVAPGEWPRRITQGVSIFLASTTLSTIVWVVQWNLFGPIDTKSSFNISIPQLASDFHIEAVVLNIVSIAIIAPISEEILCRGLLFGCLRRSHSLLTAAALSAFLFALFHLDVQMLPSLFMVGLVLALGYERTRSLVPNIIAHALYNLSMLIAVFLVR